MSTQGNLNNITALLTNTDLAVIQIRTLKYLTSKTLGIMFSASPDNPKTVANGGTAYFRKQTNLKLKEYTAANRESAGDLVTNEITVKINIDKHLNTKYEIETLDLQRLDFQTRDEYINYIGNNINRNLAATLDAEFIKTMTEYVKTNKATANEIIIADIADLNTQNKRIDASRAITRGMTALTRQLGEDQLGTDPENFMCFLHQDALNDIALAQRAGGDSATALGQELASAGIRKIGGVNYKDHIFLGQKIESHTNPFRNNTEYDFSKVFGAMVHNEAVFLATTQILTSAAIGENSGNQKYITKFTYGNGIVRPNLFRIIVNQTTTT